MEIKIDNRTNFGWKDVTHECLTTFAVKKVFPDLGPTFKEIIIKASKSPDGDERGPFNNGNTHFYSLKEDRSFTDPWGKDNAKFRYKFHVLKMMEALSSDDMEVFSEHAGRALHFLQDMTQPQHTLVESLIRKFMDLQTHLDFEERIHKILKTKLLETYVKVYNRLLKLFKNYNSSDLANNPIEFFDNLFMKNVKFSSELDLPTKENENRWENIGKKGINRAVYSTEIFLKGIKELINSHRKIPITENPRFKDICYEGILQQFQLKAAKGET